MAGRHTFVSACTFCFTSTVLEALVMYTPNIHLHVDVMYLSQATCIYMYIHVCSLYKLHVHVHMCMYTIHNTYSTCIRERNKAKQIHTQNSEL